MMPDPEIGNLKIVNVTKTLAAQTEDDFSFRVPPGGLGDMKEITYHLLRASALDYAAEGGSFWTSEIVIVKSLEVVKQGASERVNLLSGTPNIKECGGDGKLSKLMPVIERLENNEDVVMKVRNDEPTISVKVSITIWFTVRPRERRIAAQPGREARPEPVPSITE